MFQQDRLSSSSIHLLPFPFTLQAHVFLSFSWAAIVSILYPPKKCTGIIKWQKTWSMFRACVVVISGKNLLFVFWGMTVHVCHSLLYIYMFQIGIICISTDCRHFELALEMMKCCPSCFDDHQWLPTYLSFLVYLLVQQRNNIALQWW